MSAPLILTLSCEDKPGIVARVTGNLFESGANILEAQQFDDTESGRFFMRVVFDPGEAGADALRSAFAPVAQQFAMDWTMRDTAAKRRTILMVSKFDHCLGDLLYRTRLGELPMDVVAIIGNHPKEALNISLIGDVPYHHLPITRDTKPQQEAEVKRIVNETGAEFVVLARYMQILSDDLARFLSGRCINIHHSFLPSFKGAKPYHQAHARGVKMIGATGHYVTADLDEGPIIHQDVETVSHADTPEDLVRKGRDIERRVLAEAVRLHLEDRALLNGNKTVVFKG
ncbi:MULTISPECIES: formyltetrahydrofolate deformylase [unclassified Novosphingobium]|jgi:formyltetrahydrofolate deformylase|uniref:formyltetrahydrofolate deformylase n=1 Tax=unclassified Novosphingobium TaxID=2644732 RepID=UPI00061C9BA6|nr:MULTISPECIES: formyltetrahydrofolate deformylase [unclassified Novosphingobium]MBF5090731.1 formyltetrahydrofolate deformylase [Novosphingobium sp. NBM11]QCI93722.1 formyltetrahydrofolate deformylase [Novosphingobium sp. EMRT-2]RQW42919.1 formyltetrahydrofolate deformylase [Novosphingobium sp. LASN5T]GAO54723.1 formyltetrahydrofolate deformylase [Novosphingobium sp. MD-1]